MINLAFICEHLDVTIYDHRIVSRFIEEEIENKEPKIIFGLFRQMRNRRGASTHARLALSQQPLSKLVGREE